MTGLARWSDTRRAVTGVVLVLLAAPVLAACSSDGSASRPERTPSPTRPSAAASASERPTRPSTPPEESVAPSPVESERPIAAPPVESARPSVAPPQSEAPSPVASAASAAPAASAVVAAASPSPSPTAVVGEPAAAPVAVSSDDSNPWPWILVGAVVLAGIFLFAFVRRRNHGEQLETWRRSTRPAVDAARLSRDLLPALGRNISDLDHWADVRAAAEQASRDLQSAAAGAPSADAGSAARGAAEALSGLTLALESARLLQASNPPATSGQLLAADAASQARKADLDAALARLDLVVGQPAPAVA